MNFIDEGQNDISQSLDQTKKIMQNQTNNNNKTELQSNQSQMLQNNSK